MSEFPAERVALAGLVDEHDGDVAAAAAQEQLAASHALTLVMQVESQVAALHRKLDLDDGGPR